MCRGELSPCVYKHVYHAKTHRHKHSHTREMCKRRQPLKTRTAGAALHTLGDRYLAMRLASTTRSMSLPCLLFGKVVFSCIRVISRSQVGDWREGAARLRPPPVRHGVSALKQVSSQVSHRGSWGRLALASRPGLPWLGHSQSQSQSQYESQYQARSLVRCSCSLSLSLSLPLSLSLSLSLRQSTLICEARWCRDILCQRRSSGAPCAVRAATSICYQRCLACGVIWSLQSCTCSTLSLNAEDRGEAAQIFRFPLPQSLLPPAQTKPAVLSEKAGIMGHQGFEGWRPSSGFFDVDAVGRCVGAVRVHEFVLRCAGCKDNGLKQSRCLFRGQSCTDAASNDVGIRVHAAQGGNRRRSCGLRCLPE